MNGGGSEKIDKLSIRMNQKMSEFDLNVNEKIKSLK